MFAIQFDRFGPPEVLAVGERPEPHPGPGQVRIRVEAAGVSPVDLALRAGRSPASKGLALPHVPGVDAAGVVDKIGADVRGVAVGDEVFGAVDISRLGGASAQFAVLAFWAAKPAAMPWEQAGAGGTSIESATRALDLLDVRAGQTLLIDGAAGGVGSVAVQLAIARGARVIGTASVDNQGFLKQLGAVPTTYGPGLPERARALDDGLIDLALHVNGTGSLPELISVTGTGAPEAVVTLAGFTGPGLGVRLSLGEFGGQADGRHGLAAAAALFEQGVFHVSVQRTFPMARAADAHAFAAQGPRRGKVVLLGPGELLS